MTRLDLLLYDALLLNIDGNVSTAHLDVLNAQLQHLVGSGTDEVDVDAGQRGEHELLRNFVDQRHTQTFLQVHQHLRVNAKTASEERVVLR